MSSYDVRCERCGESGSIRRMDIKAGVCFYCRGEAMTHTPGPWKVGVSMDETREYPWPYYRLQLMGNPTDAEEIEANARLIASAPDLLAALEAMVGLVDFLAKHNLANPRRFLLGVRHISEEGLTEHGAILQARAAIDKATGEDND